MTKKKKIREITLTVAEVSWIISLLNRYSYCAEVHEVIHLLIGKFPINVEIDEDLIH